MLEPMSVVIQHPVALILALGWNELDALGSMIGGMATAGAFGTALIVLIREIRTRRQEAKERQLEQRDEERRQARLVYATLDPDESTESGYVPDSGYDNGEQPYSEVHVRVYNHSDAPIWDVKVPVPGREQRPLLFERVAPRSSEGNGWLDAPADWHLMNVGPGCPGTPPWTSLDVVFVDNLGRRWRRSGRAEPIRLLLDSDDL
jgi:hypothetical protein